MQIVCLQLRLKPSAGLAEQDVPPNSLRSADNVACLVQGLDLKELACSLRPATACALTLPTTCCHIERENLARNQQH